MVESQSAVYFKFDCHATVGCRVSNYPLRYDFLQSDKIHLGFHFEHIKGILSKCNHRERAECFHEKAESIRIAKLSNFKLASTARFMIIHSINDSFSLRARSLR